MRYIVGKRASVLFVLVAAALLPGCNGDDGMSTSTTQPPETTTTTIIDVSKVPAVIDVPYVQAVMNALDKVTGDAVRVFVAQRGPNQEWYETFRAVFDEPFFGSIQSDFGRYAANNLRPLRSSPGNPTTTVKRVLDSSPSCIVMEVDRSYGPIYTTEPGPPAGFVQLHLKKAERDPKGRNPSAWAVVADIDAEGAKLHEDPCK
jgi:hypothetical protein